MEGRNAHATVFEIYFKDPFLAYMYIASIPFFVALYQAFKVLGYAGKNKVFSQVAVNALRMIKRCAWIVAGFMVGGEAYLFIIQRSKEDIAGGAVMGLFLIFVFIVVAATAAIFERLLQDVLDMKSENDLTGS